MTIVGSNPDAVIGGVDTHADTHVAAVVNHVGGVLGVVMVNVVGCVVAVLAGSLLLVPGAFLCLWPF